MTKLTKEEYNLLLELYDKDKNNQLSDQEIKHMISQLKNTPKESIGKIDPRLIPILAKFDSDGNGTLDENEVKDLTEEVLHEDLRYAAYTGAAARAFRYLAFTSDFGEALRPVVRKSVVSASYAIAFGYCIADVAHEAYKLDKRGYKTEKNIPMSLTQCIVERSAFQAVASIAVPFFVIHSTVSITNKICAKIGKFQKWGPSIVGLSIIPLLPLYLDHPVEHAIESFFNSYGPWSGSNKPHHD
jgi:fission process protein 1